MRGMKDLIVRLLLSALSGALLVACASDDADGTTPQEDGGTSLGDGGISQADGSLPVNLTCPTGFIPVPGNALSGSEAFCVMKYEARCSNTCDNTTDLPSVVANDAPWVNIRADDSQGAGSGAQARCASMVEDGFSGQFALISNSEWMTLAKDIEGVGTNWSSPVGDSPGHIPRGHSDGTPAQALPATMYDWEGYQYMLTMNGVLDAPGSGWEQRRTHALSNGEEIWDLAGNVMEWVDWDDSDSGFTLGPTDEEPGWKDLTVAPTGSLKASDYQPIGTYTADANSVGKWSGGVGGATVRGGAWGSHGLAGIFMLFWYYAPSDATNEIGFRCVYRP